MLNLYKDGFTLLSVKGQREPHQLDNNWTWKMQPPVSSGTRTGSIVPPLCSIFMSSIRPMLLSATGYSEYSSTSLTGGQCHHI